MRGNAERYPAGCVRSEPIFYEDGKDWRIVDLRPHGVDCVPLFAFGNFGAVRPGAKLHVHSGCVEVCLCLKGNVRYETDGMMYPVLPGHVFISRPDEPHRRCDNPKGMMLYPKPGRIKLLYDNHYIMASLGVLSKAYPEAALDLMKQSLGIKEV